MCSGRDTAPGRPARVRAEKQLQNEQHVECGAAWKLNRRTLQTSREAGRRLNAEAEASQGVLGVSSGGEEERCALLGLGKNDLSVLRTKKRYAPLDG